MISPQAAARPLASRPCHLSRPTEMSWLEALFEIHIDAARATLSGRKDSGASHDANPDNEEDPRSAGGAE